MNKRIRIFLTVIALLVITDSYAEVADGLDKIMNPSEPAVQEPCADCPEMVSIPSLGISIGKYEVTQGQWKAIMGTNPSYFAACGDNCPVESVSWNDIQAFLVKLNQRTGQQYRLPSEKEWEAACRAGEQYEYCGSNTVDEVAWYSDNSGDSTHPVGKKKPNAFGLFDMSGNAFEWVQDCFDSSCTLRVLRGGSWRNGSWFTRSASRYNRTSGFRDYHDGIGFRFALG